MEELRDERLGKIVSWMQAYIRGYLSRKDYKKLQEQRLALVVVQRNLRKYLQLRTWPWWKLWQKIKPLLNVTRIEDEMAVSVSLRSLVPLSIYRTILFYITVIFTHFYLRLIRQISTFGRVSCSYGVDADGRTEMNRMFYRV